MTTQRSYPEQNWAHVSDPWKLQREQLILRASSILEPFITVSERKQKELPRYLNEAILLRLDDVNRREMFQIYAAIGKMSRDEYGLCEVCEEPIAGQQLKLAPYSRLCPPCLIRKSNLSLHPKTNVHPIRA